MSRAEIMEAWAEKVRAIEALNLPHFQHIRALEVELMKAMLEAAKQEQAA